MKPKPLPSVEVLNTLLRYEPETGKLFWKSRKGKPNQSRRSISTWNARYADQEAFTSLTAQGYRQGSIHDRNLLAHRVIWKMMMGEDPQLIDHINGFREDNRWKNLRSVDDLQNARNAKIKSSNSTGICGVSFSTTRDKFEARITVNRKHVFLGYFDNLEEALRARKLAEVKNGFHPNHGTDR